MGFAQHELSAIGGIRRQLEPRQRRNINQAIWRIRGGLARLWNGAAHRALARLEVADATLFFRYQRWSYTRRPSRIRLQE